MKQSVELSRHQGHWLLLHNVHTNGQLLQELPSLLAEGEEAAVEDREGGDGLEAESAKGQKWRVWLTAHKDAILPTFIQQAACKVVLESPRVS